MTIPDRMMIRCSYVAAVLFVCSMQSVLGETLRHPLTLEQQLKSVPAATLAQEVRLRGDAQRGALVFFKSPAGCVKCHSIGEGPSPLGPNLASLGKSVTDEHVIESLLYPSRSIDEKYRTLSVLMTDGDVHRGLVARQDRSDANAAAGV